MRLALLARAVREQKDENVARVHWEKAVQAGSERPELLSMLAQTASGWGWKTETEDLLWRVVKRFPNGTPLKPSKCSDGLSRHALAAAISTGSPIC